MSRILAIELIGTEARALLLSASESRITIEKSVTIGLVSADEKNTEDADQKPPASLEQTVVDALAKNGISRLETIAVVGRADVELRLLNVPKAPEAELPDIVRFQAARELSGIDEKTPLDYLPLGEAKPGEQTQRVLAAVLKPGVIDRLKKICHDAKLTLTRIVLRPAATASLMLRQNPELGDGCCLLVEMLGRQVEFAVVHRGQVVFLRHMLLSGNPMESSQAADNLFAEIRRTRVVVANQENVETLEPVVLVGNSPDHGRFAERLAAETMAATRLIDPLPRSMVADPATAVSADQSVYCAGLLGAVADEVEGSPHAFDFLHPRRPPQPPSRRNTYILGGLAAATIVLAVIALNWVQTAQLKADIRRLGQEAVALEPEVKKGDKLVADAEEVADWLKNEVVWLEELAWLSQRLPDSKDAMFTSFSATSNNRGRKMRLKGFVRNPDIVSALYNGLRDSTHRVVDEKRNENRTQKGYEILYSSSVQILSE